MPAQPSPAGFSARPLRRVTVAALVTLGLVAVPLPSPAFAKEPAPAGPPAASLGGGRSAGQPDGHLRGGELKGLSAPFGSFAPVPGRPADLPIGVAFQSLSRAAGALIRIDGQDVPNTSDPNNYAIAVIRRDTRAVVESGIVNHGNTGMLSALAAKYSGSNDFLMVVSSFKGVINDAGNTRAFTDAVRRLGGRDLTADELTLLKNGAAFSIVGVPGGTAGGAYISIDHGAAPHGDVYGYLQINVANDLYGVVTSEYPTFDTTNTSTTPGTTTVQFDHKRYTSEPLQDGQSGFLLLSFDNALKLDKKLTVVTNDGTNTPGAQFNLSVVMSGFLAQTPAEYGSTIIVRSINHPTGVVEGWSDTAKMIEKLGGNRLGFNNLGTTGGQSEYSLVGSEVTSKAAIEGNPVLGSTGDVAGVLSRNREMVYTPVSGGSPAGVNTELVDISYETPQAFPDYTAGASGTTRTGTASAAPTSVGASDCATTRLLSRSARCARRSIADTTPTSIRPAST